MLRRLNKIFNRTFQYLLWFLDRQKVLIILTASKLANYPF